MEYIAHDSLTVKPKIYLSGAFEWFKRNPMPHGPGIKCKKTEIVFATRQQLMPVEAGVYKEVTPMWSETVEGVIGNLVPAKFGFFILYRSDDTPTHSRSIAVSYKDGYKAVLINSLKGSCVVPKPYWASVETTGSLTSVDGYDAYALDEGEYVLFYDSPSAPTLGANKIAFGDRHPKEGVVEGVTPKMDLSEAYGKTLTVDIALGYGQNLNYNAGDWGHKIINPDEPRMVAYVGSTFGKVYYRSPVYVHDHFFPHMEKIKPMYLDDSNVGAGTWNDPWDLYGVLAVYEEPTTGWWGFIGEICQHRANYSMVNNGRFYILNKANETEKNFYHKTGCYITPVTTFHNYGRGGAALGFGAIENHSMWVSGFAKIPSWTCYGYNGAWGSVSFSSGAWTRYDGYWACRGICPTDYGNRYTYGALRKLIAPATVTTKTPVIAGWGDDHFICLNFKEWEDIDMAVGEKWGFEAIGFSGATEKYEDAPPSPELTTDTSDIDNLFAGISYP